MRWTGAPGDRQEAEMKVLFGEGVACHTDPESCAVTREGRSKALTGDSVGQPLSGENQFWGADAFRPAEGNTAHVAIARHGSAPRRCRPSYGDVSVKGKIHSRMSKTPMAVLASKI
jgi:hypothetical protein